MESLIPKEVDMLKPTHVAATTLLFMLLAAPTWAQPAKTAEPAKAPAKAPAKTPDEAHPEAAKLFPVCGACHSVGGGDGIGPDLKGISERRSEAWLVGWIRSSQSMVKAGDKDAIALFKKWKNFPMPDNALTDDQIKSVLAYIKAGGPPKAPAIVTTPEDVILGQKLFQGIVRFEKGGPACNSCHDVANDSVIGGGIIGPQLTHVFTRLKGGDKVGSYIKGQGTPIMKAAYEGKGFTDKEIVALVAFLEEADKQDLLKQPRDYGIGLMVAGAIGTILLFALYSFIWGGRKRESVNQAIFDRQVNSI
jgi:cytochrome c2